MTVKINADTSDGLKFVSDTSGAIDLQSNGTTKVSLDSSGNLEVNNGNFIIDKSASPNLCLLYTSPSPRDGLLSRMPSSA